MSLPDLGGIFPPIPTPFDADGVVSASGLKKNLEFLNRYELRGTVVLGSNGEGVFLDPEEKIRTIEIVGGLLPTGKLLIAGTGCESTGSTVRLTRDAARVGADAARALHVPHFAVHPGVKPVLEVSGARRLAGLGNADEVESFGDGAAFDIGGQTAHRLRVSQRPRLCLGMRSRV